MWDHLHPGAALVEGKGSGVGVHSAATAFVSLLLTLASVLLQNGAILQPGGVAWCGMAVESQRRGQ